MMADGPGTRCRSAFASWTTRLACDEHSDHPVDLVSWQMAHVLEGHGHGEGERRRPGRERGDRDLIRPRGVHRLGAEAMPLVHRQVADHPLVIDRIVVADRERDRHAGRDVDLAHRVVRVVDPDRDRTWRRRRTGAGDRHEQEKDEKSFHAATVIRFCSRIATRIRAAIAAASIVRANGVGTAAPGGSRPAATRDGLWPWDPTPRW